MKLNPEIVICPICHKYTKFVNGSVVYGPRRKDLAKKWFYVCFDCDTRVGCHPDTARPLGTPAGRKLRELRSKVHSVFDKIWKQRCMRRSEAYQWLMIKLRIDVDQCHIGKFDENLCIQAIQVCKEYLGE